MKKDFKSEPARLFKLSHQILCINGINFEKKILVGYVEMTIHPLKTDLTTIRINSKQCNIFHISIDQKWDPDYSYFDPSLDVCQGNAVKRNIEFYQRSHLHSVLSVDPDFDNGEIIINLPQELTPQISELQPFTVCIEFSLEDPKGGVHFVVPDLPGTMAERSAHLFTYGVENSSRLWFPCIDTFSELCTWKVEVTVDSDMTAISCGDLVGVECTEDTMEKTFRYFLSSPTAAPNIALAVGPFEILVDPKMHEVTHFGLPKLMPVLRHTTSYIYQAFEFYEELMSSRYPYSYYKQVFVDESFCDVATYATMSILSTNLLHPPNVIDQTVASRHMMASAVAQQFYGSFITMQSWSDAWLTKGITGFLSYLFCKKTFGNNEYRYMVMTDLQEVCEYEQQIGFVILDPSKRDGNQAFSIRSPHTLSPRYADVMAKKARLVMRMLEIRIGTEMLLQVLNKLLSLAYTASQQPFSITSWSNMMLSTSSFMKIIYTVTGKDIEHFVDLWVYQGGCARFNGNFVFNRKRNVVELEIKQDMNAPGALKFAGALNVTIQELDGSFNHTFKIEENKTKFEITCHSKSRRNKKKKIPLMTGEEVDMDLSAMDADSPVLWLRLDPNMHLLRSVQFEQPDYMWQYQLKYERCIVAQFEAIDALGKFPTPASRSALTNTIELEQCYYRVRQEACFCLAKIANAMVTSWTGPPAMIAIFRKMFGSHACPIIIRQNNFSNFHHYYLLKTIPQAMARLRDAHNLCLQEVSKFILDLFKYNDNSRNKWSDNYFRAALVEALAASVTPAVTNMSLISGQIVTADSISAEIRPMVEEVVRSLNLEKLMPSYRFTVTVSCLYALRTFQRFGHLPNEAGVFRDYAQPGIFRDVRVAALTCLVDFIKGDLSFEHFKWVLDFIEEEKDPFLKYHAVTCLTQNPPFKRSERSALNIEPLVERLWSMMTTKFSEDSRMRCALAELYFILYGRQRPSCLPVPETVMLSLKEKKAGASQLPSSDQILLSSEPNLESSFNVPTLTPSQLVDPFSSRSGASWNPELSSIFDAPISSTPDNMEVDNNPDIENVEQSVDLTMISAEQTVGAEVSMEAEEIETTVVEMDESVEVKVDLDRSSSPVSQRIDDVDVKDETVDDDSKARLRGLTSSQNESPPHPSPSYSSPRTGPPEDVVISLDNIIKSEPQMPPDIFARSPTYPIPPVNTTSLSLSPPPASPSSSPPHTHKPFPARTESVDLEEESLLSEEEFPRRRLSRMSSREHPRHSPPLSGPEEYETFKSPGGGEDSQFTKSIHHHQRRHSTVVVSPEKVSISLDVQQEPGESPSKSPSYSAPESSPVNSTSAHELEPSSPARLDLETSSYGGQNMEPPTKHNLGPSSPARRNLEPSFARHDQKPSSPARRDQGPSSPAVHDMEYSNVHEIEHSSPMLDMENDSPLHVEPSSPAMHKEASVPAMHDMEPSSPPTMLDMQPSPPAMRDKEASPPAMHDEMQPSPPDMRIMEPSPPAVLEQPAPIVHNPEPKSLGFLGLKITGAMSGQGVSEHKEERSSSSGHKSKKKKKKNKHKHKHKHKHDRGDKEEKKGKKEKLLLDTSSRTSWNDSPSVTGGAEEEGGSSSELEVG